jgi:hypothetical protein
LCCEKLITYFNIEKYPITFSPSKNDYNNDMVQDMEYGYCPRCGSVQLMDLVPQHVLYMNSHNGTSHSTIWNEHHEKFCKFVEVDPINKVIDVGGTGKFKDFYVLNITNPDNAPDNFIQGNCEDFDFTGFQTVVMSHVFEHLYNPVKFIQRCVEAGVNSIFISHPVMDVHSNILQIHTEHTFFADAIDVQNVFERNKFRLDKIQKFRNHSIFFKFTYDPKVICANNNERPGRQVFILDNFNKRKNLLSGIDIPDNTYIMPAGHFGQLVFYYLKNKNIIGFLDNDIHKQGNRVYGTPFFTDRVPDNLHGAHVLIYAGVYTNEIAESISSANCTVLKINV